MRIGRLRIRDLQRHADLELELAPGLTVIRGPNEAGKTTIQRAIELALFRKATAAGAEMEALRRWNGDGAASSVELTFTDEDGGDGSLVKTFAGARGQVRLAHNGQELNDPAAVDRRLSELTGLPSEKFFRSTASVHHHELEDLDKDEGALRDRLQASMSGADRGTAAARKKLREALRRFDMEGIKNPGILKEDRDRVAALDAEVARGEAGLRQLAADGAALSSAREAHAAAESRLAADRELLARSEQAVGLLEREREAQGRYGRYKRAAELRDEIAAREAAHPSSIPLAVLRPAVEKLRLQEQTISSLRAELADEPDVSGYDVGALPTPDWRRWALLAIVLAAGGIFTALGGLVAQLGERGGIIGLVIAAGGVVVGAAALVRERRGLDVRRQNVLREEQIARRLSGRSQLEQQLRDTLAARDRGMAEIEQPDLATAEHLLAAEADHVAGIETLAAEYRGVLGAEQPTDDVARLRDMAAAEAEQARHALAGLDEIGADPIGSRDRFGRAVKSDQDQYQRTVQDLARAQAAVEQNPVDAEQVASQSEALTMARERLAADERRARIIRTTLETLDRAEEATMKKAARFLEQRMAVDVARITGGRYRRVRVDEAELGISVWAPERGDWVPVEQLSQGTLDAFYLAARLGLVRQVTQDRRPPLIFDDPFLTFDDERAKQALELLRAMAADHQVIYLTTSARYDPIADLVITLPGPLERDLGEPAAV